MSFDDDIKRFNEKVEKAATDIFRGTALSLFGKVVIRTPVDTGRLRENWMTALNRMPGGSGGGYEPVTLSAKLGDSIYMTNNLPYIEPIENGSSEQAPSGMVKVTVAEFEAEVKRQAAKNKT